MSAVAETYRAAIACYNAGDLGGFADAHDDDAVLVTPTGTFAGRAAIRGYWGNQLAAFPDLVLTVDELVEQGDVVAAEWTWVGTNTGPIALRGGHTLPATGRRVQLRGMELVRIRDNKITEYHVYWDGLLIAEQLGVPQARGRA